MRYLTILFLLYQGIAVSQPKKIALLIGCGTYPFASGWSQLSAVNDIQIVKKSLSLQGFSDNHIYTISDSAATRQGILTAIEKKLIDEAQPGDIVFFHFSGHGQQVWDDNSDEIDGYDEAIVPYDSPKMFVKNVYEGAQLIRDDELADLFQKICLKIGKTGQLLILMDACHSGSGTRGNQRYSRGTDVIMASPGYIASQFNDVKEANTLDNKKNADNLAPMVSFFSCLPQETSWEYPAEDEKTYGLMSYAFSKYFSLPGQDATYRGLLDKIQIFVSSEHQSQTPQAEGNLDRRLLDGKILGQPSYYKVVEIFSSSECQLNAGQLNGLNTGSIVTFYPVDIRDTAGILPLAIGTVDEAGLLDCLVKLDRNLPDDKINNSWVYLREKNYGNFNARLRITLPEGELKNKIISSLPEAPFIELSDEAGDLLLELSHSKDSIRLITMEGQLLFQFHLNTISDRIVNELQWRTRDWLRANFLRSLDIDDTEFKCVVTFIHADQKGPIEDQSVLKLGDVIRLKVENQGLTPIYFSVLDIQPDHQINMITGDNSSDFFLNPKASWESEPMEIGAPLGLEVLKVFATTAPIELGRVFSSRGTSLNSVHISHHPLEWLMESTFNSRGKSMLMPLGGFAVQSKVVWIVE